MGRRRKKGRPVSGWLVLDKALDLGSTEAVSKAKWLFIHSDCDFYREELKDYYIHTKDFKYMQNFGKGKDHSGSKVKHLYITNYVTGTFNHTEEEIVATI